MSLSNSNQSSKHLLKERQVFKNLDVSKKKVSCFSRNTDMNFPW